MSSRVSLRGISWNHSRAYPPLVAAAQRFEETHPGVDVRWSKRSLHEFGHTSVAALAREFDLLVIDHPSAGEVLAHGALLMLEDRLPLTWQKDLADHSVGESFASYVFDGHLFALPIDAASPVAACRKDLLDRLGVSIPSDWGEVMALARSGKVVIPGFHVDVLLTFLGICVSSGGCMFSGNGVVQKEVGRSCLQMLRELATYVPEEAWNCNPIAVYEEMSLREDWVYCPFGYGYHNYSRPGFARHPLQFANLVSLPSGARLRGVLGGTGLAIATGCKNPELALEFSMYVASESCQRHIYLLSGGQSAHACVWKDETANLLSGNFFENTFESTQQAWVRPRYAGYIGFQERAGVPIVEYLRHGGSEDRVLETVDRVYRESHAKA